MPRVRQTRPSLVLLIALVSAATLLGCAEEIQPATVSDVLNRSFTFKDGVIFHPALAGMSTTLAFTNNGTNFSLFLTNAPATTADGTNSLNPCILTVTFSTYASGAGPQANDTITLQPCDFDRSNKTLIIGNGSITEISSPAVPLGT